ncbi:hypothetical protein F442_05584 [Phytophthora nicotianae P10297]|uniref:Uncharacterized protein n=1 Tax=Phytophthora nicotianae P10297 TaxID=1317064 RepID=W2ZRC3_PHYNI|nr:hypothetical protein F442_05584 [Phytophthora nicotianae P10297]
MFIAFREELSGGWNLWLGDEEMTEPREEQLSSKKTATPKLVREGLPKKTTATKKVKTE